ncbi:MAG: DUF2993 domain-containing protein [Actinobacteria bacterium]|nr:DUF2993 domain-containing protein [Actinomycetota bacterium]
MTQMATRRMRAGGYRYGRGGRWFIAIIVIVAVLVGLDFGSRAVAESIVASNIQQQGLKTKPSVSIAGFPFLTQLAQRDFRQVTITASDVPAGPVTITAINAGGRQIRINNYTASSGTIGSLSGSALINFTSLGNAITAQVGPLGSLLNGTGLRLSEAGPSEVRATVNLVVTSGSAVWRVTRVSGNALNIHLVSSTTGLPQSLVDSIRDVTLQLPKLPLGLTIDSVSVTPDGVVGQVSGRNVPFGS